MSVTRTLTAMSSVALEGQGRAVVYAGGWSDYQSQRQEVAEAAPEAKARPVAAVAEKPKPQAGKAGLTFTEKHRLEALPDEIARLEAEIAKLAGLLADPELYAREPAKFRKASDALAERQGKLSAAEEEWLELEEKASA